jgi:tetratricopeptide (TPR) repeat protein
MIARGWWFSILIKIESDPATKSRFCNIFMEVLDMVDHKNKFIIGSALLALTLVLTASYSRSSNPQSNNSITTLNPSVTTADFKPTQAQQLWLAMDEAEKNGRYDEALAINHAIQTSHGNHYLINYRAGRLCSLKENHAAALESYQKASTLAPGAVAPLNSMASSYIALGKTDLAIKTSLAVLVIDPMNPSANRRLAELYILSKQYLMAETYYLKMLSLTPEDLDIGAQYAWCLYYQGRVEEARKVFGIILTAAPSHTSSLLGWNLCESAKQGTKKGVKS